MLPLSRDLLVISSIMLPYFQFAGVFLSFLVVTLLLTKSHQTIIR